MAKVIAAPNDPMGGFRAAANTGCIRKARKPFGAASTAPAPATVGEVRAISGLRDQTVKLCVTSAAARLRQAAECVPQEAGSSPDMVRPSPPPTSGTAEVPRHKCGLAVLAGLLIGAVIALAGLEISDSRQRTIAEVHRSNGNLDMLLAEQTSRTLREVDRVLQATAAQIRSAGIEFARGIPQRTGQCARACRPGRPAEQPAAGRGVVADRRGRPNGRLDPVPAPGARRYGGP